MLAAKQKTVQFLFILIYFRMVNELLRQLAATQTPNRIYDKNSQRKSEKSPIGTSEKIRSVVLWQEPTKPRKPPGQNPLHLRRSHQAPEMSLYRAYFVPGGMDPFGLEEIAGNIYGDWEFTWGEGAVGGQNPNEFFSQRFDVVFKPKSPGCLCGCDKIGFVQTLQPLKLADGTIDESNSQQKLDRATENGTFLDRADGFTLPWYGTENDGSPRTNMTFGKRLRFELVDATMLDIPSPYYSEVVWTFETCAVCIEGEEANFVYGCLQGISFTLRGGRNDGNFVTGVHVDATTTVETRLPTHADRPTAEFLSAVQKWNEQDENTKFNHLLTNPCDRFPGGLAQ